MTLLMLRNCALGVCLAALAAASFRHSREDAESIADASVVDRGAGTSAPAADVGERICIPGVDFAAARSSLVLAVEYSCPRDVAQCGKLLEAFVRRSRGEHIPVYVVAAPARSLADGTKFAHSSA